MTFYLRSKTVVEGVTSIFKVGCSILKEAGWLKSSSDSSSSHSTVLYKSKGTKENEKYDGLLMGRGNVRYGSKVIEMLPQLVHLTVLFSWPYIKSTMIL